MTTKAVRYTQPLLGARAGSPFLVAVTEADEVLIRQDGAECTVYGDNDKAALANPVPIGVDAGEAGLSTRGELLVYLEAGRGYDAQITVGETVVIVPLPDISPDVDDAGGGVAADLVAEATTRATADTALAALITAEATARAAGDSAGAAALASAISALSLTYDEVLAPTTVKTANYTAAPKDFIPVDTTAGSVTITLPTAPADKSRIAIKHIIQGAGNVVTYTTGGSDVLNKVGGATSGTLTVLAQAVILQYKTSTGIWYVQADDLPLSQLDGRFGALESTSWGLFPRLAAAIRAQNDTTPTTLRTIALGSSVALGPNGAADAVNNPGRWLTDALTGEVDLLGNLAFAYTNGAVSGHVVADLAADYTAAKTAAGGVPILVGICMGMNDGMPAQYHTGQTYTGVYTGLASIIDTIRNDGADVVIYTTPHPHTQHATWWQWAGATTYPGSLIPTNGAARVTAKFAGIDKASIEASYRHFRVNQAMRAVCADKGVALIDAERLWFKAISQFGQDALFNADPEYAHPNLLGMKVSYLAGATELARGLARATFHAGPALSYPPVYKVLVGNSTRTATTTPATEAQLTVTIGANQVWAFEYHLFYTSPVAADFRAQVAGPSGSSGRFGDIANGLTVSSINDAETFTGRSASLGSGMSMGGNTSDAHGSLYGIVHSGSTGGDVIFQFCQVVSDPTAATLYADSYVRAQRIS